MNREEINKLQIYLRNTFKNNDISIIPRADKTEDSAEFGCHWCSYWPASGLQRWEIETVMYECAEY